MTKFSRTNVRAAKTTATAVLRIRELYNAGWTQGRLSREFHLSVGQIGRIVRGEAWQEYSHAVAPHPDEIQHSLAKLEMILPVEGAELEIDPVLREKLERELEQMSAADLTPRPSDALEEVLRERAKRIGGQQNEIPRHETGGVRAPTESREAEGSISGGGTGTVLVGPFPEESEDTDRPSEDAQSSGD
jgi:hypothetical protein